MVPQVFNLSLTLQKSESSRILPSVCCITRGIICVDLIHVVPTLDCNPAKKVHSALKPQYNFILPTFLASKKKLWFLQLRGLHRCNHILTNWPIPCILIKNWPVLAQSHLSLPVVGSRAIEVPIGLHRRCRIEGLLYDGLLIPVLQHGG